MHKVPLVISLPRLRTELYDIRRFKPTMNGQKLLDVAIPLGEFPLIDVGQKTGPWTDMEYVVLGLIIHYYYSMHSILPADIYSFFSLLWKKKVRINGYWYHYTGTGNTWRLL